MIRQSVGVDSLFVLLLALMCAFPTLAGAQTGTLFVEGDSVGVGTATPQSSLHVKALKGEVRVTSTGSDGQDHASLLLQVTDGSTLSGFEIRTNHTTGSLEMKGPFGGAALKFRVGAANNSFVVGPAGPSGFARVGIGTAQPAGAVGSHSLDVNGAIFQRGSSLHADYVFAPSYELGTIEQHADYMWSHHHLPGIPARQVDEEGREVIEIGAHRRGVVEELEKAHIYIEQLHDRIRSLEETDTKKSERLSQLEERLALLEANLR